VHRLLLPCAGFLLAVLWMDLMFDVQVAAHPAGDLPSDVIASVAAYYRRVTTDAAPMGNAIGVVMLATVVGSVVQLVRGRFGLWLRALAALAACAPVALAQSVVFPDAVELGRLAGTATEHSELARAIYSAHLVCFASILLLLAVELRASFAVRRPAD